MSWIITNAISPRHWTSQRANKANVCQFSWPLPCELCSDFISQVSNWIGFRFFQVHFLRMLMKCSVLYESMDEMWKMSLMYPSSNWKWHLVQVSSFISSGKHIDNIFIQTDQTDVQETQIFWSCKCFHDRSEEFTVVLLNLSWYAWWSKLKMGGLIKILIILFYGDRINHDYSYF